MRRDVHVYNESTGFVITSEGLAADRRADDLDLGAPGSRAWRRVVEAGRLLPVELVQDDPFVVRVVVDEDLSDAEEDERVGRLEGRLELPDGRLALSGGVELLEEGLESAAEYTQVLDVSPGTYRLTVDAHLPGVNGEHLLGRAMGRRREAVGAYFRRTRGKKRFPAWLQARCSADPREDPGHEDAWREVEVEVEERPIVDFVVHLTKLGRKKVAAPRVGKDGWVGPGAWETRVPEACPLGLPAKRLLRHREPSRAQLRSWEPPDVAGLLAGRKPLAVEGGPVEVPVEELGRVFLLAWFATDASHPEVRLTLPARDAQVALEVEGVAARRDGAVVRLCAAPSTLKWEGLDRVRAVGRALAGAVPDGTVLELLTACPAHDGGPAPGEEGRQRYRGPLRGARWRIEATHPPVPADVLREALALAAQAEGGRSLELRDAAEARDVHARAMKEDGFLFDRNPLEVAGASLRLREAHAQHLTMVAQHAFRARYADMWSMATEPEGLDDVLADLDRELADMFGAPTSGEVIFEGAFSAWVRADVLEVPDVDRGRIDEVDRGMAALGFARLGDMVCRRAGDVALRGYALPGGHTWGVLMVGTLGQGGLDLVTEFEGGGMVTTTTTPGQQDDPARQVYRSSHPPGTTPLKLLFEHRKSVAAREALLGRPRTIQATLGALAAAMDAALGRELGGRRVGPA